ncbi:MAG: bifunctional metallophosphatase/5'-nucleotidase [Planctomycetes bacterium]|nr:bifunctional metallophosphatase/5'-nucleotidase [Planctomycetota bacterium]
MNVHRNMGLGRRAVLGLLLALPLGACAATGGAAWQRPQGTVRLVVLHTNDIHGQVLTRKATWIDRQAPPQIGGLPRVAGYVNAVRRELAGSGTELLVLDGGDWYQGTPEGGLERGLPFVEALAAIDFDALVIGNHEFDHSTANLQRLLVATGGRAVCANLRDPASGERAPWIEPWRIVECGGLRIALVGLLTPETPSISHPDTRALTFVDPALELATVKRELAGRCDLILPVSHMGVEEALATAKAHPDLPLFVTGHSHTFLKEGKRDGGGLVVQAGAKASAVGRVELEIDGPSAVVTSVRSMLVDLLVEPADQDRDAEVERRCAELVRRAEVDMQREVGELATPLKAGRGPFSTLAGNWVADLVRERMGAEVGIHNRGGTRAEIDAGPVTVREVFEMLPFDNDVVLLEVLGADLENVVRGAIEGTVHSGLDYSGLRVFVRSRKEDGATRLEFVRIEIGGLPLDPQKTYKVALNSFLAGGGDGYKEFARSRKLAQDPILLRELAEAAFVGAGRIEPQLEARIVAESQP